MVAKVWKKVLLAVLVLACLFNIMGKIVSKPSLKQELEASAKYTYEQNMKSKLK